MVDELIDPLRPQYSPEQKKRLEETRTGKRRTGMVDLRSFDEGVLRTLRACLLASDGTRLDVGSTASDANYYLLIEGVDPPPGRPGVPVTFAYPEDVYEKHVLPTVVVRRDDISAAMQRWHAGQTSYRVPAYGAQPRTVTLPDVNQTQLTGYDKYEEMPQPEPVDILYTVSILARHRQGIRRPDAELQGLGLSPRQEANRILQYVLTFFHAYGPLFVKDDLGELRTYEVFREGISMLDDLPEVAGRVVGFAVTLRVEAQLNLAPPTVSRAVTSLPSITYTNSGT